MNFRSMLDYRGVQPGDHGSHHSNIVDASLKSTD